MKKTFKIIALSLMTGFLASCAGFLDEKPTTQFSDETAYASKEALESQMNGIWLSLNNTQLWTGNMYEYLQCGSGLVIWKGTRTTDDFLDQLKFGKYSMSNNGNVSMFTQVYIGINRCNRMLDNLPDSPVEEDYKLRIEAETKLVRAIFYYLAVRVWGDVPLLLTSPKSYKNLNTPRTAWYKVYARIIEDLEFAEQNMRTLKGPDGTEAMGLYKHSRPCNTAATALKASVYLTIASLLSSQEDNFWDSSRDASFMTRGKDPRTPDFTPLGISSAADAYQLAYDAADDVIRCGDYSLVPNYYSLFMWTNPGDWSLPERILTIQSTDKGGTNYCSVRMLPQYPPGTANKDISNNNYGRVRPDRFYVNEFMRRTGGTMGGDENNTEIYVNSGDPRLDATMWLSFKRNSDNSTMSCYPKGAINSTSAGTSYPYFRKYADPTYDVSNGKADFYLLRFSEMYLIRAEAAAMLSGAPKDEMWNKALADVETLHDRARKSFDPRTTTFAQYRTLPSWKGQTFASKEDLRDAIIWERFLEMGAEGHEWFDTHRLGATWLRDNIAIPKNQFYQLDANKENFEYVYSKISYPEDVQDIRKGLLAAFPEQEIRLNTAITPEDQNDFYWN